MTTYDFTSFNDTLIVHFGVNGHEINADTLANSLIGLSNSIKYADSYINNGFSVELIIEATGEGSFKISAKVLRHSLNNLFSRENIKALVLGLIGSAIWFYIQPKEEIKVIINTHEYIVEKGNERIVLPRESEKYFDSIKNNPKIKEEISRTFKALDNDSKIDNIEFHSVDQKDHAPEFTVDRNNFFGLSKIDEKEKEIESYEMDMTLIIIKAILEKSLRKWQFKWNNKRVSAPILDFDFYNDFTAHKITIAPGDTLQVRMRIIREKDMDLGVMIEKNYEIVKVYKHDIK